MFEPQPDKPEVVESAQPAGHKTPARPRRVGRLGAAMMVGTVLAGSAAGVVVLNRSSSVANKPSAQPHAFGESDLEDDSGPGFALEDMALGELADELEELGLELTISPDASEWSDWEDSEDDDWEDDWFEDSDDSEDDYDDYSDDYSNDDSDFDDEEPLASFKVANGSLVNSKASADQATEAKAIWSRFAKIIPADQRGMVSAFELMGEEYGGAHVYQDEADPTKWILGVSEGIEGEDLDYILVHEFGHLLTLQSSEIPTNIDSDTCPTYDPGEGCALKQSTIAEFVEAFWPQSMRDEIDEIVDAEDWDALDDFYSDNSDKFITDYATTDPVEDLAETFAYFVLEDRPTGSTIADEKIQMLWADKDMVALRAEIRSRR